MLKKIERTRLLALSRDRWDSSWTQIFRELELAGEEQAVWKFTTQLKYFYFFSAPDDESFLHQPHWLAREIQGQVKSFKTANHHWFVSDEEASQVIRFEKNWPLSATSSQDVFSWISSLKEQAKLLAPNGEILDKWRLSLLDTQKILCDFYVE